MPKIYQLVKGNPFVLPKNLYRQILYLIKDYDRIKLLWEEELYTTQRGDGGPRGSHISDPTFAKAVKRIRLEEDLKAMDKALEQIPEEYQEHVINHARYGILAERLKSLSAALIGLSEGISNQSGNIQAMGKEVSEIVKHYAKEAYNTQIMLLDDSVKAFRNAENEKLAILSSFNDAKVASNLKALSDDSVELFISEQLKKINEELHKALMAAPQAASDMLNQGKAGIEEAFIMLDEYNPLWKEKGAAFMEYFNEGAAESGEDFIIGMSQVATDAMNGMLQAIEDARPGITKELEDLAQAILAALRSKSALNINSPSKKTYEIGAFTGEGLIAGTVDTITGQMSRIREAASGIAQAAAGAANTAGTNLISESRVYTNNYYNAQLPINFENVDMRGQSDIAAVSENLAFLASQAMAGKGGK